MRYILLAGILAVLTACSGAPISATVPLERIDLDPLLLRSGDLPGDVSGAQVRRNAPAQFDGAPAPAQVVYQQFMDGPKQIGGVTVFLYEQDADREATYQLAARGMTNPDPVADIGNQAVIDQPPALEANDVDVLFHRCRAVAHIRLSGANVDSSVATAYARRLDQRLSVVAC